MTLSTPMFEVSQCVSQYNKVCDTRARSILSFAQLHSVQLQLRNSAYCKRERERPTRHTALFTSYDFTFVVSRFTAHRAPRGTLSTALHMHVTCKRSDLHWLSSRRLHGRLSCVKQKTRVETRTQPPTALTCKYAVRYSWCDTTALSSSMTAKAGQYFAPRVKKLS